jgi:hypothetical protein
MDQYAPVQPRLRSVPDPLLQARHPPALLLRELDVPASGVREIPQKMLEKFREARVADCVQHYARWDLGQENDLDRCCEGRGGGLLYHFPTQSTKRTAC